MSQAVSSPLYAAIDLGSNSFHMLVVRHIDGSVQTMAKIKRKVRLAAGLDENNALSLEAMQRGWDCLSSNIPAIKVVTSQSIIDTRHFTNQAFTSRDQLEVLFLQ